MGVFVLGDLRCCFVDWKVFLAFNKLLIIDLESYSNTINEFDLKINVRTQRTHLTNNSDRKCSSWSEKFDNQGNKKFKETKSLRKKTSGAYNQSHESPLAVAYNLRCKNLTFIR